MQTLTERRTYPGHLVLTDELFAEAGRCHHAGRGPTWGGCPPASPASRSPVQVPQEKKPTQKALWKAREALQWALEAAHILELGIKRLSQEVENIPPWFPHSLSGSHLQHKSLNRYERSLSQCRPERHVTFCGPEVELISGEGPYREPQGYLTRAQMERGGEPFPHQNDADNENRMGILL